MHALLVTYGTVGDLNPFIGLGTRLRERGHDVTLILSANLKPLADGHGLKVVPYGQEEHFQEVFADPSFWSNRQGFNILGKSLCDCMAAQYQAITDQSDLHDAVLLAHPLALGARIAHDKLGLPLVTVLLSPANILSAEKIPVVLGWPPGLNSLPLAFKRLLVWAGARMADRALGLSRVNAFRTVLGLDPLTQSLTRWWLSQQLVVGLFPDWFGMPQPDWPREIHLTSFPRSDPASDVSAEVRYFLAEGEPPILFTPGSRVSHGRAFFKAAVKACELMDRRGVLVTESRDQIPARLPSQVRHFDYVPFAEVLKHHAAIVHHGGIGTLAQAMAAGIPQLIVPMSFDQPDNAQRARQLGVGEWLSPSSLSARNLARKLGYLLNSDKIGRRCASVAQRLAGVDSMPAVCRLIERFEQDLSKDQGGPRISNRGPRSAVLSH